MLLLSRYLVCVLIAILGCMVDAKAPCSWRSTCDKCLELNSNADEHACDWIPSRFSCAPRSGEDDFLSGLERVSDSCERLSNDTRFDAPPHEFRQNCNEGGVYSVSDGKPFGAYCDCPLHFQGSRCQICDDQTKCPAGNVCKKNVHGIKKGDKRALSCECTSEFCKNEGYGRGQGLVNVQMHFGGGKDDSFVTLDIMRGVEHPSAGVFSSPLVILANLTHCSQGKDVSCAQACGQQACPSDMPWQKHETCRVWTCDEPESESMSTKTVCPEKSSPWAKYSDHCQLVRMIMRPPFLFVCRVPKDAKGNPVDDGTIKCGFSTQLLPQGEITLDCSIGSCAEDSTTPSPTSGDDGKKSTTFEDYFICSGKYGDQNCWATYYFLILVIPSLYTLGLISFVVRKEKQIKISVEATRILRSHLLDDVHGLDIDNNSTNSRLEEDEESGIGSHAQEGDQLLNTNPPTPRTTTSISLDRKSVV